jgi:uracil-DNA glycosylase
MPSIELTLLLGSYAQDHYLGKHKGTLADRVRSYVHGDSAVVPLPHPSPRNTLWLRRNPWFEAEIVPALRERTRRFFA